MQPSDKELIKLITDTVDACEQDPQSERFVLLFDRASLLFKLVEKNGSEWKRDTVTSLQARIAKLQHDHPETRSAG